MSLKSRIAKNIQELRAECKGAQIIAVTKYSSLEEVIMAHDLGLCDLGENRTADLSKKAAAFLEQGLKKVRWHFIGNLQTNKVRELLKVPNLWAIHSVGSVRLLEELYKRENEFKGPELKIFLQVNTSNEEEKSGFDSMEELHAAVELMLMRRDSKLKLFGLMTMGPIRTENFEDAAKRSFQNLQLIQKQLQERYRLPGLKLSMGMSQDYKMAMDFGADYVRIGSKIFK